MLFHKLINGSMIKEVDFHAANLGSSSAAVHELRPMWAPGLKD